MLARYGAFTLFLTALFTGAAGGALAEEIPPGEVEVTDDLTIEQSLTGEPGDAFAGLEVFIDRKLGNCVACHTNFDVKAMQFLGNIGPSLDWTGERLTEAEIRAILVNPKVVFGEQTIMPAFYSLEHGARTAEQFQGKPILTAEQIENVVAYLSSLRRN